MASSKLIGYIISIIGIIVILLSYAQIRALAKITNIPFSDTIIMIIGAVLAIIGIFFAYKGSSSANQAEEVPIYEGEGKNRRIVGYKKMSRK